MCQDSTNIEQGNTGNDTSRMEQSNTDDKTDIYKSSELILNIYMDEYSKERDRSERFDNKAGLFVTALIALLTIYIQIIPFEKIKSSYENSHRVIVLTVFIVILVVAIVFFIISFIMFIISLLSREYQKVNIDDLKKCEENSERPDIMAFALNQHYAKIIDHNRDVTNKKFKYCQNAIIFTLITFLLLLISTIGIFIII